MRKKMALIAALMLGGCAVGSDYTAPVVQPQAAAPFLGAPVATAAVQPVAIQADWWKLYDDPVLNGLVQDALKANTDIRIAVARLQRARAMLSETEGQRLPQTSISVGASHERLPEVDAIPGNKREMWLVQGNLSVGYEVDLFGRVQRSIEAAHGDVAAADADADAVRIAVVADTIRAYVDAATTAERLAVARRSVSLLNQSLRVTGKRYEAGRAAKLDVLRINALRDQQAAHVPEIEAEHQAALFRLAMLTGRLPRDLPEVVASRQAPPVITQAIPVGDGKSLLERRPDVRAAERRLAADTARIGVATADLYPRITLGGSIGQTSTGLGNLFGAGPFGFLLGSLISWDFPNQITARACIAAAHADADGALAAFDGTVLRALQETETALAVYSKALERRAILVAAREEADAAVRVVRARQREGQVDFLTVLDAERTAADAASDVAVMDGRVASAQIDLFRALGGGWENAKAPETVASAR